MYHTEEELRRAGRRKSPWNLILVPLCFGSAFLIGFALFRMVWVFHTLIYPGHVLKDFWRPGIGPRAFIPSMLMVWPLFPGALGAGFCVGNILAWFVGPARRTFEKEAQGHPGTDFKSGMKGLIRFTIWALPIGLAIALIAATSLTSLN
jgi:hypothetical protein